MSGAASFKPMVANLKHDMKQSHFTLGTGRANINPMPQLNARNAQTISPNRDEIKARKDRLTKASWNYGQSPIKYESIQQSSYWEPGKNTEQLREQKETYKALKNRISSS